MEFSLKKEIRTRIKWLAYYQIVGGIVGLLIGVWAFSNISAISVGIIIFFSIGTLAFSYSILCGQRLLKGELQKALALSKINQLLQFFTIGIFGFLFKYAAGIYLALGFDFTDGFQFALNLQLPQFNLRYDSSSTVIVLQVNLVALYLLYLIETTKTKIKQELLLFNSMLPAASDQDKLQTQTEVYLNPPNEAGNNL